MSEAVFLLLAGLVVVLTLALALALGRGSVLARVRETLGVGGEADVEAAVRAVVDARRTAEWDARQRAEDLAYLAGIIGVGIIGLDDALRVRLANQAAHALLDRPIGSLDGRTAMETFADHELEAVVLAARERGAANGEFTLRGRDGPTLVVRARRSPVRGIWVVLEDVSELRRLQRIRSEFVDNLSHELRTPLTNVRLLTETLTRDLEETTVPARVRERVARIDVETGHLVQMVNELLDLSRIESGGARLYLDLVDVADVVRAASERLALFAERQGVHLETALAQDVPLVNGDAERLGQVLLNLLHNAVKFSPAGGSVTIRAAAHDGRVLVEVADQGPGIAAADRARIFERFYKTDRARVRGRGGTGLGLAIARHIVEGHGGRIWVESEEGAGAVFRFSIPVAVPAEATEPAR